MGLEGSQGLPGPQGPPGQPGVAGNEVIIIIKYFYTNYSSVKNMMILELVNIEFLHLI